jgi:hypothetical protein
MQYAVDMGSGVMYIPNFMKIGSGIYKLLGRGSEYEDTQTRRVHFFPDSQPFSEFLFIHFVYVFSDLSLSFSLPVSPATSYFSSSLLATWCRWGVYIIVWYDCGVGWTGSQPC